MPASVTPRHITISLSHQKENNVFPIELLSRLLVWAHDIWSVAANKAAIGAPDFASWVCHLFMYACLVCIFGTDDIPRIRLPGGFAHADTTADEVKDLLTNGAPFKTGLYPGTAYFKGTEGNKKDQQTKSLALLKNVCFRYCGDDGNADTTFAAAQPV